MQHSITTGSQNVMGKVPRIKDVMTQDPLTFKLGTTVHEAAGKLINPNFFHGNGPNQCKGDCAWMQNCVTDAYGEAMKLGFLDSGILKEMAALMR